MIEVLVLLGIQAVLDIAFGVIYYNLTKELETTQKYIKYKENFENKDE